MQTSLFFVRCFLLSYLLFISVLLCSDSVSRVPGKSSSLLENLVQLSERFSVEFSGLTSSKSGNQFTKLKLNCAFSALTLLVGRQEGHRPVKTEWWGTGMVICLDQGANDLCMVQLAYGTPSSLAPVKLEWFTFLVPAYPGCPGKKRHETDVVEVVNWNWKFS